jgi:hypothetical protein
MKMENVLKAERDCVVEKLLATARREPGGGPADHRVQVKKLALG